MHFKWTCFLNSTIQQVVLTHNESVLGLDLALSLIFIENGLGLDLVSF